MRLEALLTSMLSSCAGPPATEVTPPRAASRPPVGESRPPPPLPEGALAELWAPGTGVACGKATPGKPAPHGRGVTLADGPDGVEVCTPSVGCLALSTGVWRPASAEPPKGSEDPDTAAQWLLPIGPRDPWTASTADGAWMAGPRVDGLVTEIRGARTGMLLATVDACGRRSFSRDGRVLLVADDFDWRAFEVPTGRELRPAPAGVRGHSGPVSFGATSADGRWIATCGERTLVIWEAETRSPVFRADGALCEQGARRFLGDALAWGPTVWRWPGDAGPRRAVATEVGRWPKVWTLRDGQPVVAWSDEVSFHACDPDCIEQPLDGRLGDTISTVAEDGRGFWTTVPAQYQVRAMSADGRRLAVGGDELQLWSLDARQRERLGEAPDRDSDPVFSADGGVVAWASEDGRWWSDGGEVYRLDTGRTSKLVMAGDGRRVAASFAGTVVVYEDGVKIRVVVAAGGEPLAFDADGNLWVTRNGRTLLLPVP